jgi:hypothetical protein
MSKTLEDIDKAIAEIKRRHHLNDESDYDGIIDLSCELEDVNDALRSMVKILRAGQDKGLTPEEVSDSLDRIADHLIRYTVRYDITNG